MSAVLPSNTSSAATAKPSLAAQLPAGNAKLSSPSSFDPTRSDTSSDLVDISADAYDALAKSQPMPVSASQAQACMDCGGLPCGCAPMAAGVLEGTATNATEMASAPQEVSAQDAKPGSDADESDGSGKRPLEKKTDAAGLTEEERQDVNRLKRQDAEVRAHEAAHKSAAGAFGGAPVFQYIKGPDGKLYAVSGEVAIDVSPVPGNPEATARKMDQIRRAALAPISPSMADRSVAAMASQIKAQAQAEMRKEREAEGPAGVEGAVKQTAPGAPSSIEGETAEQVPPAPQSAQANDATFAYGRGALAFGRRGGDVNLFA